MADLPGLLPPTAILGVIGGVLGAIIGSFVGAVTLRWPQGRGIVAGRSACDSCQRQLAAFELVPVLSYAALAGRCRSCRAPIGRRQPALEIAAAVIGGVSIGVSPDLAGTLGAVFGWVLLALLVLDREHFWLPDRLTIPLAAGGLAAAWLTGADLGDRLLGLACGYGSLWLVATVYRARTGRDGIGGGDPKLLAAIGAWLGVSMLPMVLVAASVGGLVLVGLDRARGTAVDRHTPVAFGALLALAAWPLWVFSA